MIFSISSVLVLNALYLMLRVTSDTGAFPRPLTKKEEEQYIAEMVQGSLAAKNKLIEHNLRLVVHIVKKYYSSSAEQDDLISIGTIGLIKGISSFKPDKNTKLSTYAARCIENEILMYFRSQKKTAMEISLCEPIDADKDGNTMSLMDIISCTDKNLEYIESLDQYDLIQKALLRLDPREREIIILRYGLFGNDIHPQREIAKRLGISRSYISRIEKKALKKMQIPFLETRKPGGERRPG